MIYECSWFTSLVQIDLVQVHALAVKVICLNIHPGNNLCYMQMAFKFVEVIKVCCGILNNINQWFLVEIGHACTVSSSVQIADSVSVSVCKWKTFQQRYSYISYGFNLLNWLKAQLNMLMPPFHFIPLKTKTYILYNTVST